MEDARGDATMRSMCDSTKLTDIPADAQMAASYVNGFYAVDLGAFAARFAKVPRVLIDVTGADAKRASVRDWENGDKGGSLEQWVIDRKASGGSATVYCNRSTIPEVRQLTGSQILSRDYWLWVATLDGTEYTGPGVVACQNEGVAQTGGHFDRSKVYADWWHPQTAVTQPPASGQAWHIVTPPPGWWKAGSTVTASGTGTDGKAYLAKTTDGENWSKF